MSEIARFDKERPEPQLVFQATTSLKDVYPAHHSISSILDSIQTRSDKHLPFMLLDWQTGQTKAQYFTINPDNFKRIRWSILEHSYHQYQLPHHLRNQSSNAPHMWNRKRNFNIYDMFATRPIIEPKNEATHVTVSASGEDKVDLEAQQAQFDRLSADLISKLTSGHLSKKQARVLDAKVLEMNSYTKQLRSI